MLPPKGLESRLAEPYVSGERYRTVRPLVFILGRKL